MNKRLKSELVSILGVGIICAGSYGCGKQSTKKEREVARNLWGQLDKEVYKKDKEVRKKEPPKSIEQKIHASIPDSRIYGKWISEKRDPYLLEITENSISFARIEDERMSPQNYDFKYSPGKIMIDRKGNGYIAYRETTQGKIEMKYMRDGAVFLDFKKQP